MAIAITMILSVTLHFSIVTKHQFMSLQHKKWEPFGSKVLGTSDKLIKYVSGKQWSATSGKHTRAMVKKKHRQRHIVLVV